MQQWQVDLQDVKNVLFFTRKYITMHINVDVQHAMPLLIVIDC